jgi:hypothetical protein
VMATHVDGSLVTMMHKRAYSEMHLARRPPCSAIEALVATGCSSQVEEGRVCGGGAFARSLTVVRVVDVDGASRPQPVAVLEKGCGIAAAEPSGLGLDPVMEVVPSSRCVVVSGEIAPTRFDSS